MGQITNAIREPIRCADPRCSATILASYEPSAFGWHRIAANGVRVSAAAAELPRVQRALTALVHDPHAPLRGQLVISTKRAHWLPGADLSELGILCPTFLEHARSKGWAVEAVRMPVTGMVCRIEHYIGAFQHGEDFTRKDTP